jgi:hypothetical protein
VHSLDQGVVHLVVGAVPPPGQDVGGVEDVCGQPLLGSVEDRGSHIGAVAQVLADRVGDGAVHAVGIPARHLGVALLVAALAPHRHPQRARRTGIPHGFPPFCRRLCRGAAAGPGGAAAE